MNQWYFNPIMFEIGPFQARWYGFMYALAFLIGYLYLHYSAHGKKLALKAQDKDNLVLVAILGIVLGARLGYALFYNFSHFAANPLKIFAVWEGGMASHGALIGSILAIYLYARKKKVKFLSLTDAIAAIAPAGIILIRLGNFINAELYGRVATSFCIYFPTDPENCRYPSQLFQAFLEGFILLLILQYAVRKVKKTGVITSLFLILYGVFRIIIENFREPDAHIGFLFGTVTAGQTLSAIMVIFGVILYKKLIK